MELKEITIEDLRKKSEKEDVQVIDIRPSDMFEEEHVHIKAIQNIPLQELPDHLDQLKKDQTIYTLCNRGNSSKQAAVFLQMNGFDATSIKEGTMGWKEKYPNEVH
ncbi:MAG: rhodanese-like domain-containing protein [Candidatus Nanoarchaeia archaeon]